MITAITAMIPSSAVVMIQREVRRSNGQPFAMMPAMPEMSV